MLLLGHTGITLGLTIAVGQILSKKHSPLKADGTQRPQEKRGDISSTVLEKMPAWLAVLHPYADLRLLLVGSLLPDIIDKPVGLYFLRDTFGNGRIFSHTLLFLLAVVVSGLWLLRKRRKTWLLVLAYGTFTHLVFDRMWLSPPILFWPIYGFGFPRRDVSHWLEESFLSLLTVPEVYIPEIIGAAVFTWLLVDLTRRRLLLPFVRNNFQE
ncbi:MAG: metal-dependent hydrolase [Chloroflexi bacterium]|nr:metal-dependent hydrolase [Chloroflexota bacterium]